MTIKLISKEQLDRLLEIQKAYPNLTYNNRGYDSLNLSRLTPEELKNFKEAEEIISTSIKGFSEFNHFKPSKTKPELPMIRFQYNYSADIPGSLPFKGVGYLFVHELHYGFDNQEDVVITKIETKN